jgi:SMI1/KNR4 family protein SUKH-1
MTLADWKAEISRIVHWKQISAENDKLKALPWHLPKVGASEEDVAHAEAFMGTKFSSELKEFLTLANGWKGFHVLTDLFGTDDFLSGRAHEVLRRPELAEFITAQGWSRGEATPIGASDLDLDVFLHISPESSVLPGGVVWFASEEVDRYLTFHDFLSAMVNYNARVANKLAQRRQ